MFIILCVHRKHFIQFFLSPLSFSLNISVILFKHLSFALPFILIQMKKSATPQPFDMKAKTNTNVRAVKFDESFSGSHHTFTCFKALSIVFVTPKL